MASIWGYGQYQSRTKKNKLKAMTAHWGASAMLLAHKFIDFILDAEIGAQLSNYNYYASPNAAAEPYLDEALKQPPAQPTEEEMKRLRFTPSLEGEQLQTFQQLWSEVQAR